MRGARNKNQNAIACEILIESNLASDFLFDSAAKKIGIVLLGGGQLYYNGEHRRKNIAVVTNGFVTLGESLWR